MTVVVRTSGAPEQAAPFLRRTVASLDAGVAVSHMSTMDAVIDEAFTGARFYVTQLSIFAAVATVLAIVGLHGVMADAAESRRHEFGVRLALGATRGRVFEGLRNGGAHAGRLGRSVSSAGRDAGRAGIVTALVRHRAGDAGRSQRPWHSS